MKNRYYIQALGPVGKQYMKCYAANDEQAAVIMDIHSVELREIRSQLDGKIGNTDYELFLYTAKDREKIFYYQSENRGIHSTYIYPSKSAEGEYIWEFQSGNKLSHEQVYKKLEKKGYQYFKLIPIELTESNTSNLLLYFFLFALLLCMIIGNI